MTTKRKTVYYVAAVRYIGGTRNTKTNYLLGPFETQRAAWLMIPPVARAVRRLFRHDARFTDANFQVVKLDRDKIRPGSLDLFSAVDDNWRNYVLTIKATTIKG